ncbi:MAG: homoserine kinase [Bacteroidota bacterium]
MKEIRVFCPATVANISCGFDVLGMALENVGDEMVVRKTATKGIRIAEVTGQELPLETTKNVAGVAGLALLGQSDATCGFEIAIHKRIKPGSGIGSSAASSAGVVWAINQLLGQPFTPLELVNFAMQGEKLASNVAHADNVAPALFGGFTLIRSYTPLDVIPLPVPSELYATVVHPQIEIKTSDSRKILKTGITLETGIKQWGNLGGLVAGLFKADYDLIGRSLEDHVVEPVRSLLIPMFDAVKHSVESAGALGMGISGSGPSIFALSKGSTIAKRVAVAMAEVYQNTELDFEVHVSPIGNTGVKSL